MKAMAGSTRTIWIMAITAVVSLAAGLGLSRFIVSPSEAAANAAAPEAGPITVPVELRSLTNDVVMRGDAIYEDPAQIMIETGDIGGAAVVTGQVPQVGATLDAGAVILEVTGRPVILLTGELPVYRTLRAGLSGPDVAQLKAALAALGISSGNPTSTTYDAATAAAVRELYARVGYEPPTSGTEADATLALARDAVQAGENGVAAAQRDLTTAGTALQSTRVAAQTSVDAATAALNDANAVYNACIAAAEPGVVCETGPAVQAQGTLATAIAVRDEAYAAPDTSSEQAAVASARQSLSDARDDLADAQQAVITPLPASEIVYLPGTPRRVDSVAVKRGSTVAGTAVMSVSGATLQIAGTVTTSDAGLLVEGASLVITLPDDTEVPGVIGSIGAPDPQASASTAPADPDRKRVVVVPAELTEEQRQQLQGANVRVSIPVSATQGEVLAVPVAALTAGPGGEARVEVLGDGDETTLVTVTAGLAADGFVEVVPVDGTLTPGDLVIVGANSGAVDDAKATPDEESAG